MSAASVSHLLETAAGLSPEAVAVVAPGLTPLSYAGLLAHVRSAVRSLNALGVGRGDRVGVVLPDGPEAAVAFLSVAAGAASAPSRLPEEEHVTRDDTEQEGTYKVVVNHEEQYSIWPRDRENPVGWRDAGRSGSKADCLAYIEAVWTDMRPRSLRQRMDGPTLEP